MHTKARLIQLLPYLQERQILYEEALSYSNFAGKQGRFSYQNTLTRIGHKIPHHNPGDILLYQQVMQEQCKSHCSSGLLLKQIGLLVVQAN